MATPPNLHETLELRAKLPAPTERRAIRERLGLSRELMARDLGVSLQTLAQWEAGHSEPRLSNLVAYVELLERLQAESDREGR